MIATHNLHNTTDTLTLDVKADNHSLNKVKHLNTAPTLLPSRIITHHPKAGLNPLVDAAGYLFTVLGKLKYLKTFRQLSKLQKELQREITLFQETVKKHGYKTEHIIVCRYILCATFDDIISNTTWGGQYQWDAHSLTAAFNHNTHQQEKVFTILEHAIKEPSTYIDLMELIYLCLSMGYKGHYRATEYNHYQLEQITHTLFKHIRAFRGHFKKTLSPVPLKLLKPRLNTEPQDPVSLLYIFFVTGCISAIIFLGLGYLMDVITNEAYKNIVQIQTPLFHGPTHL